MMNKTSGIRDTKAAHGYVAFNIFPDPQVLICKVGPHLSHRSCSNKFLFARAFDKL